MRVDRESARGWMRAGRESARGRMRASITADVRTHWLARGRSRCARAGRALVAKAHSLTARRSREHAPLAREPRKRTCALRHARISSGLATSNAGGTLLGGPTRPISIPASQRGNQWLCQTKIDTNSCLLILEPGLLWPGFRSPPPDGRGGAPAAPAGPRPPGRSGLCQSWLNIEPEKSLLSQDWHEPMLFQLRAGPLRPGAPQGPRLTDRGVTRRLGGPRAAGPTRPISILA